MIAALILAATAPVAVAPQGGTVHPPTLQTAGYDVTFHYAENDAPAGAAFTLFYVRKPTQAEMLPIPAPPPQWGGPTAVAFFSFTIAASAPVHVRAGSTLDVIVPFRLDDSIRYDFSAVAGAADIVCAPVRPNANELRFVLPAFTANPGEEIMGEIDGDY